MRKLYIFGAVVTSAALGFIYGQQYALRKHKKEIAQWGVDEVQRMRDIFEEKLRAHNVPFHENHHSDETPVTEDMAENRNNPVGAKMSSLPGTYKDYSKIRSDYQKSLDAVDPMAGVDGVEGEIYESFQEALDFEYDEIPDGMLADEENRRTDIHQIDVHDFMDDAKMYDEYSLSYYPEDGLVLDHRMVPVENVKQFVGDALGIFDRNEQGDTDVIFVRNPGLMTDYEIILENDTVAEAMVRWKSNRKERRFKADE